MEKEYPELTGLVHGENYPAPPLHRMIASLVGYLQLAAFAVALFGRQLCSMFGLPHTPAWLGWVQENKFKVLFAAFIASNFASRLTSTGAFEVIVDGRCAPVRGVVSVGLAVCIVFSCVVRVVCACVGACVFAPVTVCLRVCAFVEPLCAHRTLAGDTVFSKLEMGRLPTFEELRAGLDHLEFGGTLA